MITLMFLITILIVIYSIFTIVNTPYFKEGDLLISRNDIKEFRENKPSLKVLKVGKDNYLLENLTFNTEQRESPISMIDHLYVKYEK